MNEKSITLSEAKQKRGVEKKFFICTLNSQITNWCMQGSEKPLQPGSSSTKLVPRLYLLPAVSPVALHRSHSSRLPPIPTSAQNPNFFNPASPALTTIPLQYTSPLPTPLTDRQPYPSQLTLSIPLAPVIQTVTALFPKPTSWSCPWHHVPAFSTQALCGFICSSSI